MELLFNQCVCLKITLLLPLGGTKAGSPNPPPSLRQSINTTVSLSFVIGQLKQTCNHKSITSEKILFKLCWFLVFTRHETWALCFQRPKYVVWCPDPYQNRVWTLSWPRSSVASSEPTGSRITLTYLHRILSCVGGPRDRTQDCCRDENDNRT